MSKNKAILLQIKSDLIEIDNSCLSVDFLFIDLY